MVDAGGVYICLVREKFVPYHLLAWSASLADATETDLTPVNDIIQTIQNGHYLPQVNWQMHAFIGMAATLPRARLSTATIRQITTPFMSPLETSLTPLTRPGVADFRMNPLQFTALEEVIVLAQQTSGGAARFNALAAISFGGMTPVPGGPIYTLRGTSITAAVANVWTQIVMTWNDTLPAGLYAVVGVTGFGTADYAIRVVFEDSKWRPGGLCLATENLIPSTIFTKGGLGEYGRFNANRMPNIEILCNGATAAHTVYLDIVRVG